jgi:hypothetical protein
LEVAHGALSGRFSFRARGARSCALHALVCSIRAPPPSSM